METRPQEPLEVIQEKLQVISAENKKLGMLERFSGPDRVMMIDKLLKELAGKPASTRFMSGLTALDKAVDGFQGGEVVVVSGPTGQGKTTFLQTLTYGFADRGVSCLWFSYEVGIDDFVERFGDNVPSFALPRQMVASNMVWLESKIWEGLAKYGSKVVFIDHLHFLMKMSDLANVNASIAIGFVMRELKRIALETHTIIFLVSHVKKIDFDAPPTIGDLRDSSFVGQESDMVFMIWRDQEKGSDGKTVYSDYAWLKVEKNRRKGRMETFKMNFKDGQFHLVYGGKHE